MEDKCKKCRRAGEKLFLKGEKCYSPKCTLVKKPYAPGIFGKSGSRKGRRGFSEYGIQMREKQKVKFNYGLRERQFANYVSESGKKAGEDRISKLFEFLESRLDNVIFRGGLAGSRSQARQAVSHGHISVNNRRVNIPSYRVKKGDKISIRVQSGDKGVFKDLDLKLKKFNPPSWIELDKAKKEIEISGRPELANEPGIELGLNSIIEFYSR